MRKLILSANSRSKMSRNYWNNEVNQWNNGQWMGKAVLPTCQDSPQSWVDTCSWPPSSWRWRRPACDWTSRWQLVGQSRQTRLKLKEIWRSSAQWAGSPGWPSYARWGHLSRTGQSQFNSSFRVWFCEPWMKIKLKKGQCEDLWQ